MSVSRTLAFALVLAISPQAIAEGAHPVTPDIPLLATGNLSVDYIQHSPIGVSPTAGYQSPLPSVESLRSLHEQGLWAYEDYIAWGAVETSEGRWDWSHHNAVFNRLTESGLAYIPYIWCHVPPVWLRDDPRTTLMTNIKDGKRCYMLSIYDPRTIAWYKRFYQALHAEFGDRLDEVYACLLGPYGEGNYPLPYVDFVVKVGDCADNQYWCGDPYALPLFQKAMKRKYHAVKALNEAWGTSFAHFDDIQFPDELQADVVPDFTSKPVADRQRWLDFIHWYHQALIDFSAKSIDTVSSIFGRDRVATKPGGNCGNMNPVSWGTYNPGFAKMAGKKRIAMQSADSRGAYWADKWTSTAYAYYGVPYRTEAAGGLDANSFALRTFTDISCGATRLFTYEIETHLPAAQASLPLFTGERGLTDVALLAPTTVYYLNGNVMPAVETGMLLRDSLDYDVLDELLVCDGALKLYRVLIASHCNVVEPRTLAAIRRWVNRGGLLLWSADRLIEAVDGNTDLWVNKATPHGIRVGKGWAFRVSADFPELSRVAESLVYHSDRLEGGPAPALCVDGRMDTVWTTVRSREVLLINRSEQAVEKQVNWRGTVRNVVLPPFQLVVVRQ